MLLTVHHIASSGGSIVSQVLTAATNSVLVSEINPLGSIYGYRGIEPTYDPTSVLWHLVYNSKELNLQKNSGIVNPKRNKIKIVGTPRIDKAHNLRKNSKLCLRPGIAKLRMI